MDRKRAVRHLEERLDQAVAPPADEPTVVPDPPPQVVAGGDPSAEELGARQMKEAHDTHSFALTTPFLTSAQSKGMLLGGIAGGVIGALVCLPIGLISWGDLALGWRLLVTGIVGLIAGAVCGAVYWGGRLPELAGETEDLSGRPGPGTTPRDSRTDDKGRG